MSDSRAIPGCPLQHPPQVPSHHQQPVTWNLDPFDETADHHPRLFPLELVVVMQRRRELLDPFLEDARHVRVQGRQRGLGLAGRQERLQFSAARLDLAQLRLPGFITEAVQQ